MSDKLTETVGPVHGPGAAANEAGARAIKGLVPDFASDDAAEAWIKEEQPPLPAKGSGKRGTITKADVTKAVEEES